MYQILSDLGTGSGSFWSTVLGFSSSISLGVTWGTFLGAGSHSGIWILSFNGNILLLKSLRTFSLALRNNLTLFRKDILSGDFTSLVILTNLLG